MTASKDEVLEAMARGLWERQERLAPGVEDVAWETTEDWDRALQRHGIEAALSAAAALGWRMVPVEPSDEMLIAAIAVCHGDIDVSENSRATYVAMLSAAPSLTDR